ASRLGLLIGVICFALTLIARAQTPDTAALRGIITGPNGHPLTGVRLTIEDANHRPVRELRSGTQGDFVANDLPAGTALAVSAAYPGFAEAHSGAIVLAAGSMASLQLDMRIATARSEVRVTGEAGDVRIDEPQL